MTTFSASNLQNEALAKIGVFQNPDTRDYYYGGKRDKNDKVSGSTTTISTEDAEKLAQKYIDINIKAKATGADSIDDILKKSQIYPDKDGNYIGKDGNILPPEQLLNIANALLEIAKTLPKDNTGKVISNLPSTSPEQEKNLMERAKLIATSETVLKTLFTGYLGVMAQGESFGNMNDPNNIQGEAGKIPIYQHKSGVDVLMIIPPPSSTNVTEMGGGAGIGWRFR